ncbi:putative pectate lyase 7 [Triticum urartu]|uniref:Pectate lyase n=1 Tax=Triticum urartu TaxID=4572 RepID=M7ZES5_TRIUA|nr:putative pectate lyase 7 [Triticum urartu]
MTKTPLRQAGGAKQLREEEEEEGSATPTTTDRPASLLLLGAAFLAAAAVTSANPAYNPDPYSVVDHFNRARLARCAKGFGRETTGGLKGKIYIVTDPNDDDFTNPRPGSLRWGVVQTEPLWIIFARDMVINASQEIIIQSDKTIDGRGAQVHVANGGGLTVQHQNNVIINNLHVHGIKHTDGGNVSMTATHSTIRTRADGDGVSIFNATKVWVDHLSMDNCEDGMVDVVAMSTAVTISNTHLAHHNDVMLFGADDKKPEDKVTKRDYAPESEWKNWVWISDGDLMINDAYFTTSGGQIGQKLNGKDLIKPKPGEYVRRLTRFAGPLDCNPGSPC